MSLDLILMLQILVSILASSAMGKLMSLITAHRDTFFRATFHSDTAHRCILNAILVNRLDEFHVESVGHFRLHAGWKSRFNMFFGRLAT